ncbi:hypothetical protein GIB67_005015 [Kingdonia uniflora]|uniref:Uncharacterized protein n=1 Tax=Kingdonia uniflora TaxID=39325 RepID=A0A7J7NMZ4_9MAGN|nr:hypothetical protein GIB67_005015 [Kingdonia uniflora]
MERIVLPHANSSSSFAGLGHSLPAISVAYFGTRVLISDYWIIGYTRVLILDYWVYYCMISVYWVY